MKNFMLTLSAIFTKLKLHKNVSNVLNSLLLNVSITYTKFKIVSKQFFHPKTNLCLITIKIQVFRKKQKTDTKNSEIA